MQNKKNKTKKKQFLITLSEIQNYFINIFTISFFFFFLTKILKFTCCKTIRLFCLKNHGNYRLKTKVIFVKRNKINLFTYYLNCIGTSVPSHDRNRRIFTIRFYCQTKLEIKKVNSNKTLYIYIYIYIYIHIYIYIYIYIYKHGQYEKVDWNCSDN